MKKILVALSVMFMVGICSAADVVITITVPDAKVAIALEGFLGIYPNIEKNEDGSAKYTDKQWVNERMRRILVRDVRRGLQIIANKAAKVEEDDTIAQ